MIDNRAGLVVTYILINEILKFVSGAYLCMVSNVLSLYVDIHTINNINKCIK